MAANRKPWRRKAGRPKGTIDPSTGPEANQVYQLTFQLRETVDGTLALLECLNGHCRRIGTVQPNGPGNSGSAAYE